MTIKLHPTHARYTRFIMIVFLLSGVISWIVGYYFQESLNNQFLVNIFISIFMISFVFIFIIFIARDYFTRCPTCKDWLSNRGTISENDTRIFTCSKCQIIWDTGIKVSGCGE